jgi:hypothetical protein
MPLWTNGHLDVANVEVAAGVVVVVYLAGKSLAAGGVQGVLQEVRNVVSGTARIHGDARPIHVHAHVAYEALEVHESRHMVEVVVGEKDREAIVAAEDIGISIEIGDTGSRVEHDELIVALHEIGAGLLSISWHPTHTSQYPEPTHMLLLSLLANGHHDSAE